MVAGTRMRIVAGLVAILALAAVYWVLEDSGMIAALREGHTLRQTIVSLGPVGPLAVVGFIALAIVVSPIPSAPIALAAGAAYGHTWGTLYIVCGAELGALLAFALARHFGRDALQHWLGQRLPRTRLGSQGSLMTIVLVSRLLPFVSFDVVSYAAGLTTLTAWRFALATLAGILPTSFLLAHFGGEMATGETDRIVYSALALGLLTAIPFAVHFVREWRRGREASTLDR